MQTVTFQCGHCGNLMAVGMAYLGQQVRCPTCQQVVLAPQATANGEGQAPPSEPAPALSLPPSPVPEFKPPALSDQEDIFSQTTSDDLFGEAESPRLEMPSEPAPGPAGDPAAPPAPAPPEVGSNGPSPLSAALPEAWAAPGSPGFPPAVEERASVGPPAEVPHMEIAGPPAPLSGEAQGITDAGATPTSWMDGGAGAPAEGGGPVAFGGGGAPVVRRSSGVNWFLPLVVLPLISYSVLATGVIVFLIMQVQQARSYNRRFNPFEKVPDVSGDNPGGRKILNYSSSLVRDPLPPHLVTELGKPLTIGSLEVTPLRVERKRVAVLVENFVKPEPCQHDSLVLHLRLKNISNDEVFVPLDNYFDRHYSMTTGGLPPLTNLLAVDTRPPLRFYGGPAPWFPPGSKNRRQWVEGRNITRQDALKPGEEAETFLCTDGEDPRMPLLIDGVNEEGLKVREPYRGKFLWRIQVRRGAVQILGKEYWACAVIGVAFSAETIDNLDARG
jgi:hypothetical protein